MSNWNSNPPSWNSNQTPPPWNGNQNFNPPPRVLRRATPQHRLGGYALDVALATVTLGIGWVIWSLVIWGSGQTPAKQILKMRIYNATNAKVASWGQVAIRQFVIPFSFYIVFIIFDAASTRSSSYGGSSLLGVIGMFIYFGYLVTDALWIFKGGASQRLVDVWAKTIVVNEAA